jgi:hypothetical protein
VVSDHPESPKRWPYGLDETIRYYERTLMEKAA